MRTFICHSGVLYGRHVRLPAGGTEALSAGWNREVQAAARMDADTMAAVLIADATSSAATQVPKSGDVGPVGEPHNVQSVGDEGTIGVQSGSRPPGPCPTAKADCPGLQTACSEAT